MRTRPLALVLAVQAVLVAAGRPALGADPPAPGATSRRDQPTTSVAVSLGLGTPLGVIGLALERSPSPWVTIGAGVGMGVAGPQLAAFGRTRILRTHASALSLGVGLSAGTYEWREIVVFDDPHGKRWALAYWANLDASYEHRFTRSIALRLFAGLGRILNGDSFVCIGEETDCAEAHSGAGELIPYLGIALARDL